MKMNEDRPTQYFTGDRYKILAKAYVQNMGMIGQVVMEIRKKWCRKNENNTKTRISPSDLVVSTIEKHCRRGLKILYLTVFYTARSVKY